MSGFTAGSIMYNINTETELASVLSHFDSAFIFDLVKGNLTKRYESGYTSNPNLVISLEQNFKSIKDYYQFDLEKIEQVRQDTYYEIINIICNHYGLIYSNNPDIDLYSAALYLYDFLVANFANYISIFFSRYIHKERTPIYDSMNLAALKKNKDSSTLYGKKMYRDVRLAVINANLAYVIDNMKYYDLTLHDILSVVYPDKNVANFIANIITPTNDFFKVHYMSAFVSDYSAIILSNIRFEIQRLSSISNALDINTTLMEDLEDEQSKYE